MAGNIIFIDTPYSALLGLSRKENDPPVIEIQPSQGPLPLFPLELWSTVLAHVARPSDLAACAQLSHSFCRECERLLYRSVDIRGHAFGQFARTITHHRPALGAYVEFLRLDITNVPSFHSFMRAVLQKLPSLRELDLRVGRDVSGPARRLLEGVPFNLRRFSSDLILREDLFAFLSTQSNLYEWKATPDGADRLQLRFPHGILPNLKLLHIIGHRDLAFRASFSPHVTHLRLDLHFRAARAPTSQYEEHEITRACDIFGPYLVSFRLNQPYRMEFRRRLPSVVFYILSQAPVLKFLHLCEPHKEMDSRVCARSFIQAVRDLPQPVATKLETIVWGSAAFKKGKLLPDPLANEPAALPDGLHSSSELAFAIYDERGTRIRSQTPRDVQATAKNALKDIPSLQRVVLMGQHQFVYDTSGIHPPVSGSAWKNV
ncbi:hypothetical protein B0H21DRAFT_734709 [Amylocystis lapponica]|nr:hypothetical protein B0H21DRAFT_734709 [Amylocystis lapponica]